MRENTFYEIRQIDNLKDMMEQNNRLYGEKEAFLVKISDDNYKKITYSQFKKDMDALGTALTDLGLKEEFIAVMSENRYEWCVTYLSTVNGLGVTVPIDKELPLSEIENLLTRSNAKALVYSGKLHDNIKKLSLTMSSVKYFINMDLEENDGQFLSYGTLLKKGHSLIEQGNKSYIDSEIDNEKMSILLFTSGTTDHAKGVMLSHKNISSNIMSCGKIIKVNHFDLALSILPLHHTYECTAGFLFMMYNGAAVAFNEGLKHIGKNLKEVKPTLMLSVPLILESMHRKVWEQAAKKGKLKKLKTAVAVSDFLRVHTGIDLRKKLFKQIHNNIGGRMRLVISGAAAINPDVIKGFRSLGIKVLQGYGLTECSPIATCNRENENKDESIGLALPGVDVRIDNPDEDGIGEIIVKGENVMLGYFDNPLATKEVLKNEWLHTGDLGKVDDKGFFTITGRKKNVIVTKNGKNIFPEEVESYINKSPYILESLVWGKKDEASEVTYVWAQIVPYIDGIKELHGKETVSTEEIRETINQEIKAVNRNMPLYKHVRHFEIRENEFAKTTTQKIKRYVEETS